MYISLAAALGVPIGDAKNVTSSLGNWKCWVAVLASFSLGFLRFLLKLPLQSNKPHFSILDGTEKESRLAIDDIKKLIDAGTEKAI
jgi:hypothetical protein